MSKTEQIRDEQDHRRRRWMSDAQAGDATAYEVLLRDLLPLVRHQVARRVGVASEREDIVQNILISLHRARHT